MRLSLFTNNRYHAQELADACWRTYREVIRHPDLFELRIASVEDLKEHVRLATIPQASKGFISLIELAGSAHSDTLRQAIKTLSAYNVDFFVLPAHTIRGVVHRRTAHAWVPIGPAQGQQLQHMRITTARMHDVNVRRFEKIEPNRLYFETSIGENRMLMSIEGTQFGIHQFFVKSDLSPALLASVRKHTDIVATRQVPAGGKSPLLSEVIKKYCEHKKRKWEEKTTGEFVLHLQTFLEMVGDKEVLQLTNDDSSRFVNNLPRIPVNRSKNHVMPITLAKKFGVG